MMSGLMNDRLCGGSYPLQRFVFCLDGCLEFAYIYRMLLFLSVTLDETSKFLELVEQIMASAQ